MAKRYYWLKLKEDFFTSKRIKKLRTVAGGDTYLIIYLKMQLLALKTDGIIQYTGLEDNFASELALDIDEKEDDVRFTLNYLQNVGLVETSDNTNFLLPYVIENTGSENASTQRVRDYRARQRELQCNTNVTEMKHLCNGEKEIDIEIEKEKETDIEIEIDDIKIKELINRMTPTERKVINSFWEPERIYKIIGERLSKKNHQDLIQNPYQYILTFLRNEEWPLNEEIQNKI